MNANKKKFRSMSLRDRTTIQLKTGSKKAYVPRNPMSCRLDPIPSGSENSAAQRGGNKTSKEKRAHFKSDKIDSRPLSADRRFERTPRSQSEMQWTPVVNITRNNTFILPAMPVDAPNEKPCFPHIEIPETDSEDEEQETHAKRDFNEQQIEDGDRNLLLQYLKKGARPSITPMNSIDTESIDMPPPVRSVPSMPPPPPPPPPLQQSVPVSVSKSSMCQVHTPKKPLPQRSTAAYSSSSSIRVHVEKRRPRRPQVLTRVSIGEDLHLEFCRGSRPTQSRPSLPTWSNRATSHGTKKSSLPILPSVNEQTTRNTKTMLHSSESEKYGFNSNFHPSDQEIIDMYRKGLLSTKPEAHQANNAINQAELFDSQYSSPAFDSACGLKEESDSSKIAMTSGSSSRSSVPNIAPLPTYDPRTSRGATNTSECDSRKTSDPNCLQIPGISGPVNSSDTSESLSDCPPNWDSKSSTPALLEPYDSRPLSCSSSLGDASLMLENDDIASLPCSPFPGAKTSSYHPGLRRRSSSIDSAFSRPGSDFLDVPQPSLMSTKDKVPALLDSPGESPICSPVSEVGRYSEDLQHQVVHRVSGGLVRSELPSTVATPRSESPVQPTVREPNIERKGSEGIVAPAVSLTTDDGDDFAVSFGRRGSIFIEEKGQAQPALPPLSTTTDEFGTVSLAVPNQRGS